MKQTKAANNYWSIKCLSVLILLLTSSAQLFAQQKTVTGNVTSKETGKPVEGVTVAIKGSTQRALTDDKGEFSITVPSTESVLVFSYVGMNRQEKKIGSESALAISLVSDDKSLDDVVVVGYGTQKRSHLTGSVGTINIKSVQDLPVGNLS